MRHTNPLFELSSITHLRDVVEVLQDVVVLEVDPVRNAVREEEGRRQMMHWARLARVRPQL